MLHRKKLRAAVLAVLVLAAAGPAHAQVSDEAGELGILQDLFDRCRTLMRQFDAARPTDAAALALRTRGEERCYTNTHFMMGEGVEMLKAAIRQIGLAPPPYL